MEEREKIVRGKGGELIRLGACSCTDVREFGAKGVYVVWGGWDGNFDPTYLAGVLRNPGDSVMGVCRKCLGSYYAERI